MKIRRQDVVAALQGGIIGAGFMVLVALAMMPSGCTWPDIPWPDPIPPDLPPTNAPPVDPMTDPDHDPGCPDVSRLIEPHEVDHDLLTEKQKANLDALGIGYAGKLDGALHKPKTVEWKFAEGCWQFCGSGMAEIVPEYAKTVDGKPDFELVFCKALTELNVATPDVPLWFKEPFEGGPLFVFRYDAFRKEVESSKMFYRVARQHQKDGTWKVLAATLISDGAFRQEGRPGEKSK